MRSTKAAESSGKQPSRKSILAGELTDEEIRLIRNARFETDATYELDDLDEDGKLSPSKRPS
ncbi:MULTISPECIES: hypothetical protein [unclassified Rhizobium]|jgi:hypothetical protein|uniref:hypothetical protein n=1 Tax=unclassified Rhizobium TaxID=2613769 RepID=UPI000DDA2B49|nr:hypothetical protein [Rhizobium sp. UBA1881]